MVVLIVLNIILIIALIFLALYIVKNKKDNTKIVCENNGVDDEDYQDSDEIEYCECKEKKKQNTERVFEGKIITDEEYQEMTKYKRSNISVLINEIDKEYERLKELNK